MNLLRRLGTSSLAVLLGIAEVLAIVVSAIVVVAIIIASFIVRACADAAERRRLRSAYRLPLTGGGST